MADNENQGEEQIVPAEDAATQDVQAPSVPVQSGYTENEGTSTVPTQSSNTVDDQNRKREEGKIAKLQRELNEKNEALTKINSWARSNPSTYYDGLINVNGYTPEQALASVRSFKPDWTPDDSNATTQSAKPSFDEETQRALDKIKQDQKAEEARIGKAITDFEEEHPGLNESQRRAIGAVASMLRDGNPDLTEKEVLDLAGTQVLSPEKFKEEGMVEGMMRARSGKSASSGGGSGGALKQSSNGMGNLDQEVAAKLGIDRNPEAAKIHQSFFE